MLDAKSARRPSTISAGKNAINVSVMGMSFAFHPRFFFVPEAGQGEER